MRKIAGIAIILLLLLILPASAGTVKTESVAFVPVYEADVYHTNTSWENWTMMIANATGSTVTASSAARVIGLQSGTAVRGWDKGEGNYTRYYRMIYVFDLRSIPINATVKDGYLSINVSENSTKLGHTQIVFTRAWGHTQGLKEKFTDPLTLSITGYKQWLNVNSAGEANMTSALEINKTPINRRWNFTLSNYGIDEINNNTFRNTANYGNYTVFMGRLGWDATNYTVNPLSWPEFHYNMDTKVSIYSFRTFNWNETPMLILNYTVVEAPCAEGEEGSCQSGYNTTSFVHDSNYVPIELEYIFILIGFGTLILSRKYGILVGIIPPLAFGIAAWYANFMEKSTITGLTVAGNPFMVHSEIIVPSPSLSVIMIVCFLISIVNILDILFMNRQD